MENTKKTTKRNISLVLVIGLGLLYIHLTIGPAIAAGLLVVWYSALGLGGLAALTKIALGIRKALSAWQISAAEVEAARGRAKIEARHIVAFGRDQQVFEFDGDNTPVRALHLTPLARFNGPTVIEPMPQELATFQIFHQRSTKASNTTATQALLPAPATATIPTLVHVEDIVQPDNVSLNHLALGIGPGNEIVRGSLKELSHVGVGGTSQWGKSIFLQSLLYQILLAKEQTEVFLSDIGGTSFVDFGLPYADDVASTEKMAGHLWEQVLERKRLYQATGRGIRSLDMYNQITDDSIPYLIFICDETTVLMSQSKPLAQHFFSLVAYAGKYGLELILAGQNWKAKNIDSTIRDQFSSRFQFKAMDFSQANILIKNSNAHDFTVRGRACAYLPEYGKINLQVPHIKEKTIQALATQTHGQQPATSKLTPPSQPTKQEQRIIDAWNKHQSFPDMYQELTPGQQPGGTDYDKYKKVLGEFGIKWTP